MSDRIRVLYVDDDPDLADLVADRLEGADDRIAVRTVNSAASGRAALTDGDVDCIVSDYNMPGENGIEFLERVRETHPDLPFILYTGRGSEAVASDAISAGVTDYLQKEFGTDQYTLLANRIANAVAAHRTQRTRRRQLSAIESAREGISILDEDERFIYVNQAYADLYGYDPEAMIGEHWSQLYREEDRSRIENEVLLSVAENGYWHGTTTGRRADGSTFLEDHVLTQTAQGELICTVRDVSEREELERRRERTDSLLATLFETLPVGVIAEDDSRNVLAVNDQLFDLFEMTGQPEAAVGTDCRRLVREVSDLFEDPAAFRDGIDAIIERGDPVQEEEIDLLDGRTFARSYQPLDVPDGEGHLWTYRDVTGQKERERSLRRSRSRLEVLFDQSPDMINVHDTEGNVIDPNPRFLEQTGYTEDELTEMKVWDVDEAIDPDEAAALWSGMEHGDRERLEGVYRRRDGSTFPVEVHVRRLDRDGDARFVVISRDITDRKERERSLQQERDRFRAVFEESFDGMVLADDDGNFVDANQRATELFGYPRAELLGRSIAEFAPPDFDFEAAWDEFQRSDRDRGTFRLVRPDGTERVVEYAATNEVSPGRHLSVLRDVTARERRERELEQTRERMEFALDVTDSIIWSLDLDSQSLTTYGPVQRVFGSDPARNDVFLTNVVHPEDRERVERVYERVRNGDSDRIDVEFRICTGTGDTKWIASTGYVRSERDQQPTQLIGLATDITDRTRRERELQRQNDRLEEFASIVSHDLRNPLNVAIGRLEVVQEDVQHDQLSAVANAHDRMETMIEDLLGLARHGEEPSDIGAVDLETLVRDCWRNVATEDATLVTDLTARVRADEGRLGQLIENLVRNAVEHSSTSPDSQAPQDAVEHSSTSPDSQAPQDAEEHGSRTVTITVGELPDGFFVEDDGPGIPESEREAVFEAGYSASENGTGFGLSIASQVAEAHDWEIRVAEGASGGARFEITGVEFADATDDG